MEILLTIGFFGIIWGLMALSPRFHNDDGETSPDDSAELKTGRGSACSTCGLKANCSTVDHSTKTSAR